MDAPAGPKLSRRSLIVGNPAKKIKKFSIYGAKEGLKKLLEKIFVISLEFMKRFKLKHSHLFFLEKSDPLSVFLI